jgi:S-adenosylmethionine:tRNA ribosyltransferase-isomerase
VGERLSVEKASLGALLEADRGGGEWLVRFEGDDVDLALRRAGTVPLPPYIHSTRAPAERYQTIYADREGSVAAPTAGLHFSDELLHALEESGIGLDFVTLHVGQGTFRPVTAERVADHRMHAEWGEVPAGVAGRVNALRTSGRRLIAVGTTTVRLLESAAHAGRLSPFEGDTDRFIYPGYRFQVIDGLITNFHLPRSSLLMLVSAFAGRELILHAYETAIEKRYRFYSFGDAMLIL